MSSKEMEVFVICTAGAIKPGNAKAFSLMRINGSGESRPLSIVIVHARENGYFGYVNACPHEGKWLNIGSGEFFTRDRAFLRCGRHGARFEIETGLCVEGCCKGKSLERIAVDVVDGEVCVCGIALVEDDEFAERFDEDDDTMEIMIHPD